jgi:hypothetical protein
MNAMLKKNVVAIALAAFAFTGLNSAPAAACGGEWYPMYEVDPRIKGVDKAEDNFDDGKMLSAAGSIVRMIPHIKTLKPTKTKLIQRAHRVLAVTVARYDGALPIGKEVPDYAQGTWLGKTEADRAANLSWATQTLRAVATARNDDPAARTELAEALARVEGTRAEARTILEELAAKDLITSADGYATLAMLRDGAGDTAGKQAALDRCKSMAKGEAACVARASATI